MERKIWSSPKYGFFIYKEWRVVIIIIKNTFERWLIPSLPKKIHIWKVTYVETNTLKCCQCCLVILQNFLVKIFFFFFFFLKLFLEWMTLLTQVNSSIIEKKFQQGLDRKFACPLLEWNLNRLNKTKFC